MRAFYLTLILTLATIYGFAQSDLVFQLNREGRLVVIPRYRTYELHIPEFSYQTYTPATTVKLDMKMPDFNAETHMQLDERPMDMQVLSGAYRPFFNIFTPMLMSVSPMALDFEESYFQPLNEHTTFLINGRQMTWPGSGSLTTITPMLMWGNEQWTFRGSAFAARYATPFDPSPGFVGGVGGSTSYQATDWLKINMWGQYAAYDNKGKENLHLYLNPNHHHTSIGGSMEFKISDKVGIGVGVQHEFNPLRGRWDRQYLMYPVFYQGKGFRISAY